MKYFFLIFNLLAIYSNKAQQNNSFSVYRTLYIQEQGLPSSDVICGVEDQKGFLWFGLRNGLCRFDGRDFISIPLPEGYLKTWRIESMVTDDRNGIVLTYSNPVRVQGRRKRYVINADTYETKPIAEYFVNMPFADTSINSVYKTSDNTLGFFVANPNKVWHHTWRDGFKEKYQSNIAFRLHRQTFRSKTKHHQPMNQGSLADSLHRSANQPNNRLKNADARYRLRDGIAL